MFSRNAVMLKIVFGVFWKWLTTVDCAATFVERDNSTSYFVLVAVVPTVVELVRNLL